MTRDGLRVQSCVLSQALVFTRQLHAIGTTQQTGAEQFDGKTRQCTVSALCLVWPFEFDCDQYQLHRQRATTRNSTLREKILSDSLNIRCSLKDFSDLLMTWGREMILQLNAKYQLALVPASQPPRRSRQTKHQGSPEACFMTPVNLRSKTKVLEPIQDSICLFLG